MGHGKIGSIPPAAQARGKPPGMQGMLHMRQAEYQPQIIQSHHLSAGATVSSVAQAHVQDRTYGNKQTQARHPNALNTGWALEAHRIPG